MAVRPCFKALTHDRQVHSPARTPQWRIRTTSCITTTMATRIMRTGMVLNMATTTATAGTATQATITCTA